MNNRIALFLLTLCAAVALLPAAAFAANDGSTPLGGENAVYVSAGGDDANNGSKETPLKTIGEAYDKVADGGTIYLLSDIKIEGRLVLAQNKTVTIAGQDAGPARSSPMPRTAAPQPACMSLRWAWRRGLLSRRL